MKIRNHNVNDMCSEMLRVAKMEDGSFTAETQLPVFLQAEKMFSRSIEEMNVSISPYSKQLEAIVEALNDGRLSLSDLEDIGGSSGGYSVLDI